jgi:predicted metalloprotease with PDZ domain
VYWGGAAVMLLADVELRRRSALSGKGARSLDEVLMELSRCCSEGSRPWSSSEVAERFDAIAGAPIMRELIASVVRAKTFPRLDAMYEQLGLDPDGRPLQGAPLASIRDAIMRSEASLQHATADGTRSAP